MSHQYALVVIPLVGEVKDLVDEAMDPHRETEDALGLWDWYQIGGRYSGRLSGYDPYTDPSNMERCRLCKGTGSRDDALGREHRAKYPEYTCNGCRGKGEHCVWPTDFPSHDGDVETVSTGAEFVARIDDGQLPFAIIAHGSEGRAIERETWDGENFVKRYDKTGMRTMLGTILDARERAGLASRVVVVDYHS